MERACCAATHVIHRQVNTNTNPNSGREDPTMTEYIEHLSRMGSQAYMYCMLLLDVLISKYPSAKEQREWRLETGMVRSLSTVDIEPAQRFMAPCSIRYDKNTIMVTTATTRLEHWQAILVPVARSNVVRDYFYCTTLPFSVFGWQ